MYKIDNICSSFHIIYAINPTYMSLFDTTYMCKIDDTCSSYHIIYVVKSTYMLFEVNIYVIKTTLSLTIYVKIIYIYVY